MFKTLKNSFTQTALGSTIWITLLASIQNFNQTIPFLFIWNILLIGLLFGLIFGVVYPYLWDYSTFKSSTNIAISTIINISCMYICLSIYSTDMLNFIKPYWLGVIFLTLIGHIVGFYFYSKYQNNQVKKELNNLI